MPPFQRIHVIINPAAGPNRPILNTLNDVFHKHNIDWDVSITHRPGDAARLARQAVADGVDIVAAYGGDGTIMEVANGLIGTNTPLAILPGGTGNAVAAELGIPTSLHRAAQLLCQSPHRLRTLDMGRIGDQFFILRADMGISVKMTSKATRDMKDRYGMLAYLVAALQAVGDPDIATYHLTLDDLTIQSPGIACLVVNAGSIASGLGLSIAPHIDPADGLLDVLIINAALDAALSVAASVFRLEEFRASLRHWQARHVAVTADPPQDVGLDGEIFGHTPLTVSIEPAALRVLVPNHAKGK